MEVMTENTIAVVGGGFGGVRAALSLAKDLKKHGLAERYKITLINRSPFHLYTPLLYKYAVSPGFPREVVVIPLNDLFRGTGVQVLIDSLAATDLPKGILKLASGKEIKAGYIILAPGSETNWFGIPGLKENALAMKTAEDAQKVCERLKSLPSGARVLVGGGGPNGVEVAGELSKERGMRVSIVEAAPTILPGFARGIQKAVGRRFKKLGVETVLNDSIVHVDAGKIKTKGGKELPFDMLIWTGGIQVPGWLKNLPLQTEAKGRIEPGNGMECLPHFADLTLAPSVYAVGDIVCVQLKDGSPMPSVAHAAILEGEVAAANVLQDILTAQGSSATKDHKKFSPWRYPYVMPVGGKYAIASIGPLIFYGFLMWVFKEAITIKYFLSIMPAAKAVRLWRKGL